MKRILSIAALLTVAVTQAADLDHPRQVNLDQGDSKRTAAQREAEALSMSLQPTKMNAGDAPTTNFLGNDPYIDKLLNLPSQTNDDSQAVKFEVPLDRTLVEEVLTTCPKDLQRKVKLLKTIKNKTYKPERMLLAGPAGTGKTTIAKAIATHCDIPCIFVRGSMIAGTYKNDGDKRLIQIFEQASKVKGPCVIVVDDLQILLQKHSGPNESDKSMLTTLWGLVDTYEKNNVFFIGTFNYTNKMAGAFKDRFKNSIFEISLPNQSQRERTLNFCINQNKPHKISFCDSISVPKLAKALDGQSHRGISKFVESAVEIAIEKQLDKYKIKETLPSEYGIEIETFPSINEYEFMGKFRFHPIVGTQFKAEPPQIVKLLVHVTMNDCDEALATLKSSDQKLAKEKTSYQKFKAFLWRNGPTILTTGATIATTIIVAAAVSKQQNRLHQEQLKHSESMTKAQLVASGVGSFDKTVGYGKYGVAIVEPRPNEAIDPQTTRVNTIFNRLKENPNPTTKK